MGGGGFHNVLGFVRGLNRDVEGGRCYVVTKYYNSSITSLKVVLNCQNLPLFTHP